MHAIEATIRRASILFGGIVLCLMMLQVVVDVFLRNVAGTGFPATPDLVGKYYMVAVSFLPLAVTEIKRRHIEATIFTDRLSGAARRGVLLLGFGLSLIVYGTMLRTTIGDAVRQTARGAYIEVGTTRFLTWPSYWILPVAIALMVVMMAIRLVQVLDGRFRDEGHDPMEEVASDLHEEV